MTRPSTLHSLLVAAFLSLGLASEARAQAPESEVLARAQALNDTAQKAMKAKDYATACPQLEEVVRLVPEGLGAKLTLAECYEGAGRLASAWTLYTVVEAAALKPAQAEHKRTAHRKVEALKGRLAQLTIVVSEAVQKLPGLEIRRDDVQVGVAQWGMPLPVDKGKHVVVATAMGKVRVEKAVEVGTDGGKGVVEIGGMEDVVNAAPVATEVKAGPVEEQVPREAVMAEREQRQRTGALVMAGGALVLGVGATFGIQAILKKKESEQPGGCVDGNYCTFAASGARAYGAQSGDRSTVLVIVGTAMLGAGVALLLTAPRSPDVEMKVSVGPRRVDAVMMW